MKLNVLMVDTWRVMSELQCTNTTIPAGKRLVQIEMTPEQRMQLIPHEVGISGGKPIKEQIGDIWFDNESEEQQ